VRGVLADRLRADFAAAAIDGLLKSSVSRDHCAAAPRSRVPRDDIRSRQRSLH
jgi:hypothetical protein